MTIVSKIRYVHLLLDHDDEKGQAGANENNLGMRRTFALAAAGLAEDVEVELLAAYFKNTKLLDLESMVEQIEGRDLVVTDPESADFMSGRDGDASHNSIRFTWKKTRPKVHSAVVTSAAPRQATPEPMRESIENVTKAPTTQDYHYKFSGGFVGTFANMDAFFGGLSGLIGDCRKVIMFAFKLEEEHCSERTGFGGSDAEFTTSNYKVTTTPKLEWLFVFSPEELHHDLTTGTDQENKRPLGIRKKVHWQYYLDNAAELISKFFEEAGHKIVVAQAEIQRLNVRKEEIIALRLYTGPLFELYNNVLHAWENASQPGVVPPFA